jgi:hypothetical protein
LQSRKSNLGQIFVTCPSSSTVAEFVDVKTALASLWFLFVSQNTQLVEGMEAGVGIKDEFNSASALLATKNNQSPIPELEQCHHGSPKYPKSRKSPDHLEIPLAFQEQDPVGYQPVGCGRLRQTIPKNVLIFRSLLCALPTRSPNERNFSSRESYSVRVLEISVEFFSRASWEGVGCGVVVVVVVAWHRVVAHGGGGGGGGHGVA